MTVVAVFFMAYRGEIGYADNFDAGVWGEVRPIGVA
jgi:hypothetical protein